MTRVCAERCRRRRTRRRVTSRVRGSSLDGKTSPTTAVSKQFGPGVPKQISASTFRRFENKSHSQDTASNPIGYKSYTTIQRSLESREIRSVDAGYDYEAINIVFIT